jgi:hypothetical protein
MTLSRWTLRLLSSAGPAAKFNVASSMRPRLQSLADRYEAKEVRFIAISIDDANGQKRISEVVMKRHFRITVWTGGTEEAMKEFDIGNLVPSTLMLDETAW